MMDKYGADAVRFWMYTVNQPGESKNFDEKTVDEIVKKVFNLISNVVSFYKMYKTNEVKVEDSLPQTDNLLDLWIIEKLANLIGFVSTNLDSYRFFESGRAIREFVADLSQWYIRRSRDRFKSEGLEKEQALKVTHFVLLNLIKVMAPFTPFFAEEMYQELGGRLESVHLEDWPTIESKNPKLLDLMDKVREISSRGLEARNNAKINVRQPLQSLSIKDQYRDIFEAQALSIICDEVNVKEVYFSNALAHEVELDTKITPQLKEEGMMREIIRAVQDLRKTNNLTIKDQVVLTIDAPEEIRLFISKNEAQIGRTTSLKSIKYEKVEGDNIDIGGNTIRLKLL